ncbi:helix-turn-helix domain-containing protein [Streptosporangium sp. NPDC048865]|uniref:TetR/AcrR family transcriptional regulator n=1 Tax=Streptosporangium sp. NPDC048865 TaxID=3155766 RepID=UPI00341584BE
MAKRAYTSTVRAVAARETRAAILRAAERLFTEQGYARATVAGIAERAGVALNTVYTSVGGKAALMEALAAESSGDERIQATLDAVLGSADGHDILRRTAEGTGDMTRRHESVLNLLFDNATADPAVAAAAERALRRYRGRLARIAEHLVSLGAVRTDRVRTEQILWFYFGRGGWKTVRELGWDWADGTAWLTEQAAAALLTPAAGGRAT